MTNNNEIVQTATNIISQKFLDFIGRHKDDDSLKELKHYLDNPKEYVWSTEKAKVVLELLLLRGEETVNNILSYTAQSQYGWQDDDYRLYNSCLRHDSRCCKRIYRIENHPEATERIFTDMDYIFLNKRCGSIVTYLFSYCLAALFTSKLRSSDLPMPYFLQIACERSSNTYKLIHEIVDICDVNVGITEYCELDNPHYGYCGYEHVTLYPTQFTEKLLDDLMANRDVPTIIDGYDNKNHYDALLREIANISGKLRTANFKNRFNTLPIFIGPSITAQYRNIFSMDLTELDIDEEYLEAIRDNKQRLASWVFELIKTAKDRLFKMDKEKYKNFQIPQNRKELFFNVNAHINLEKNRWRSNTRLSQKDITNIGILSFFFVHYMSILENSIQLTEGISFTYRGETKAYKTAELVIGITEQAIASLVKLHDAYSPNLSTSVNIQADLTDSKQLRYIKSKGIQYAKSIIKYYQSYGVSIGIFPDAEYKDERYIFTVKLLPGTDRKLISRYADEVRRLLGLEFFMPVIEPSVIRLIVSEKPLKENSLIKILESQEFEESELEIPYAVGYDMMGNMVIADIVKFPHLLIGGASGSGKSSALHSLLMSIVYKQPADKVKLLLFDFGASRLNIFEKTPHMLKPVVMENEIEKGRKYLLKLQEIMEQRLKILSSIDSRDYDRKLKKCPYIICVIDEFPNFIQSLIKGKKNSKSYEVINDLLSRTRKTKIHLILAVQDATKDNIRIKNTNLSAGIAFKCNSSYASKAIINAPDAQSLSGKGSMYFKCEQHEGIKRLQGSFMEPLEIMDRLAQIKSKSNDSGSQYDKIEFELDENPCSGPIEDSSDSENPNKRFVEIVSWMQDQEKVSNNQLKNQFGMGYDRANEFMKRLEDVGIISTQRKGAKLPRIVNQDKVKEFLEQHGCTDSETGVSSKE